jgi:hypothetical protein
MRHVIARVLSAALVLGIVGMLSVPLTPRAFAQGPCTTRGDNLTRNGSITEGGYDTAQGVVANSWNAFLVNGDWPAYDLADNESANGDIGGSSSQYIHGDGTRFDAGIYQVIAGVQPGASYEFSVGWAAMLRDTGGGNNTKVDDVVIRRVGYDPTGGTDPQSVNVQWGAEVGTGSSGRSLNHPDMRITFKAAANQVTVFVRVYNLSTSASDKVFFDVMCLLPRGDIPVETIQPSPTATSPATEPPPTNAEPPTPRPTRVPPTATPVPATPVPAQFLTATPVTLAQRPATATPQPRLFVPDVAGASDSGSNAGGGVNGISLAVILGSVGIIGVSLLGILLIGGFAVWRLFMRQVDDALDPTYHPDDQTHYR